MAKLVDLYLLKEAGIQPTLAKAGQPVFTQALRSGIDRFVAGGVLDTSMQKDLESLAKQLDRLPCEPQTREDLIVTWKDLVEFLNNASQERQGK